MKKNGATPTTEGASLLSNLLRGGNSIGVNAERDARIAEIKATLAEVYATDNMHTRALLSEKQMMAITRLAMFAERHPESKMAKAVLDYVLEISISRNGESRKQMIQVANTVLATEVEGGGSTLVKRLFGHR